MSNKYLYILFFIFFSSKISAQGGYLNLSNKNLDIIPDLSKNTKIIDLDLSGNNISIWDEMKLPPNVRKLSLSRNKLSGEIKISKKGLSHLRSVDFSYNNIDNFKSVSLSLDTIRLNNNKLKRIFIFNTNKEVLNEKIDFLDISYNRNLSNDLDFFPNRIKKIKHDSILNNKELRVALFTRIPQSNFLDFSNRNLDAIPDLSNKKIAELDLSGNNISVWDEKKLPPNIRRLNISGNKLTGEVNILHKELPNLEYVDFSYNNIKRFDSFSFSLDSIKLNNNDLEAINIAGFSGKQISFLDVSNNRKLSNILNFPMARIKIIKHDDILNSKKLQYKPKQSEVSKKARHDNSILDLSNKNLDSIPDLSDNLEILELNLSGNNISYLDEKKLPPYIQKLNLSKNRISNGVVFTPRALPLLRYADLSYNNIRSFYSYSHSLDTIKINNNNIDFIIVLNDNTKGSVSKRKMSFLDISNNKNLSSVLGFHPDNVVNIKRDGIKDGGELRYIFGSRTIDTIYLPGKKEDK